MKSPGWLGSVRPRSALSGHASSGCCHGIVTSFDHTQHSSEPWSRLLKGGLHLDNIQDPHVRGPGLYMRSSDHGPHSDPQSNLEAHALMAPFCFQLSITGCGPNRQKTTSILVAAVVNTTEQFFLLISSFGRVSSAELCQTNVEPQEALPKEHTSL